MSHSKEQTPDEILEFCARYQKLEHKVPHVAVRTTYDAIYERELAEAGVNIVIYANQLLRSAYPAMVNTAKCILKHGRALEADAELMSVAEIINLIPKV
jgi:phosphoenolpyruvate phosphomutase